MGFLIYCKDFFNWTLVLKKPKCLWLSSFDLQNWGVQNVEGGTKVDFNCNPTE